MKPHLVRSGFSCLGTSLALFLSLAAEAADKQFSAAASSPLSASTLIYVSDYVSFVGRDSIGHVVFALDNNRGRDGHTYQAEHFLVLHDEQGGWIELAGNGQYENTKHQLATIPDSPYFQFTGSPRSGLTITSGHNRLSLRIEPLTERTSNTHNGAVVWMGSAPAILAWQGRSIPGRVIYEYLLLPDFNRLTHTYWGMWKEFQGFYLAAGDRADVYAHSQLSEHIAPLIGTISGFAAFGGQAEIMKDLNVATLHRELAFGFYRWPTSWRITWTGPKGPAMLTLTQSERKKIGNWAIGGFSMSVVRGELDYGGKKTRVYGLVELIM